MKTKEQIERLNVEIEELKAEAHRWTETAKSLNRENIACIQTNGRLQGRWEELKNKVDILSEAFDSEEEASAYDQAVLDIQGIMQELEQKKKRMK